ncbi:MBL fold metallo-hydrolase [Oceanidesulfovibrio marinus]|nr:MBL fold metallo-hydrolase [Oceanidesulfovibrio marinus]
MRVIFLGVGEAFDEHLANTSLLAMPDSLDSDAVLLDCGFTAAAAFYLHAPAGLRADGLSAIAITHLHGDHFLGLPWLLHRLGEDGRTTRLTILGPDGAADAVPAAYELAYPGSYAKLPFPIVYTRSAPGVQLDMDQWRFRFAPSRHGLLNLAIRLEREGKVLCYSGDGAPSPESATLAKGADLLAQESYFLDIGSDPDGVTGHGSVERSIELARQAGAHRLALVHIARSVRHGRYDEIERMLNTAGDVHAFAPQPGCMCRI